MQERIGHSPSNINNRIGCDGFNALGLRKLKYNDIGLLDYWNSQRSFMISGLGRFGQNMSAELVAVRFKPSGLHGYAGGPHIGGCQKKIVLWSVVPSWNAEVQGERCLCDSSGMSVEGLVSMLNRSLSFVKGELLLIYQPTKGRGGCLFAWVLFSGMWIFELVIYTFGQLVHSFLPSVEVGRGFWSCINGLCVGCVNLSLSMVKCVSQFWGVYPRWSGHGISTLASLGQQ